MKISSKSGVTLAELIVALAIAGVVAYAGSVYFLDIVKNSFKVTENTQAHVSDDTATFLLSQEIQNGIPSFLNTTVTDDCGRNFYDVFLGGCPETLSGRPPSACSDPCKRTLTLRAAAGVTAAKTLFLVTSYGGDPTAKPISPGQAYCDSTMVPPYPTGCGHSTGTSYSASWGTAVNPVTFNATRFMTNLKGSSLLSNPFNSSLPALINNATYVTYAPTPFYSTTTATGMALPAGMSRQVYLRNFFATGTVSSNQYSESTTLWADTAAHNFTNNFSATHPLDSSIPVKTMDDFFRNLPGIGGRAVLAFMRRVNLVEYQLQSIKLAGRMTNQLVRSEYAWNNATKKWAKKDNIIASPVKSLTFIRNNVGGTDIQLDLRADLK